MVTANGPGRPLRDSIYRDYYVRVRGTSGLEILLNFICAALSFFLPFFSVAFPAPGPRADTAEVPTAPDKANGEISEKMYDEEILTKITSEKNKGRYGE